MSWPPQRAQLAVATQDKSFYTNSKSVLADLPSPGSTPHPILSPILDTEILSWVTCCGNMAPCRSAEKTAYGSERSLSTDLSSYFIHRSFELNRMWLWEEKLGLFGRYCPAVDGYVCILNSKQQQIQTHRTIKSAPTRIYTGPITIFFADPGNKCRIFIFKDGWSLVWRLFSIFRFPDLLCFWKLIHPCCEIKPSQCFLKCIVLKKHTYTWAHRCFQLFHDVISRVLLSAQLILNRKRFYFLWAADGNWVFSGPIWLLPL